MSWLTVIIYTAIIIGAIGVFYEYSAKGSAYPCRCSAPHFESRVIIPLPHCQRCGGYQPRDD